MSQISRVLVVGASGSIGRPVVDELTRRGVAVRVLVRDGSHTGFPESTEVRLGDITRPEAFVGVLDGVDAVVFVQGSYGNAAQHEAVSYRTVRNLLQAREHPLRISLMTTVGVTDPDCSYNANEDVDWKRRAERLVRASGLPYTIVRPGWFDHNAPDAHSVVFRQGDTHSSGTPADGVVARAQIAEVLVGALFSDAASYKTLELTSETGPALTELDPLFAALDADEPNSLDGIHDRVALSAAQEPERIRADLDAARRPRA